MTSKRKALNIAAKEVIVRWIHQMNHFLNKSKISYNVTELQAFVFLFFIMLSLLAGRSLQARDFHEVSVSKSTALHRKHRW